jgi:hypothetical protein
MDIYEAKYLLKRIFVKRKISTLKIALDAYKKMKSSIRHNVDRNNGKWMIP